MAENAAIGTVVVHGKSQFLSRTNIVNAVAVVAQVLDLVTGAHIIPEPWGGIALGVVNLVLRQFTVGPVGKDAIVKGELVGLAVPGEAESVQRGTSEPIRTAQ